MTAPAHAAAEYWEKRARQFAARGRGLAAVCSYGMPAFYNASIEVCQRRALLPWLPGEAAGIRSVLDVGCGIGRWSTQIAAHGHDVTGVDLSPYMIHCARIRSAQRGLRCSFAVADVTDLHLGRRFDLIVCVTVLQHVLDPAQAQHAISRLAAHLSSGGRLVLLEAAPTQAVSRCDTEVFHARPLDWYLHALRAADLTVVAQRGVDPTPLKTWLLPFYRRMPKPLAYLALGASTAVSLPADVLFARWLTRFSWHKVLVAQRRSDLQTMAEHRGRALT